MRKITLLLLVFGLHLTNYAQEIVKDSLVLPSDTAKHDTSTTVLMSVPFKQLTTDSSAKVFDSIQAASAKVDTSQTVIVNDSVIGDTISSDNSLATTPPTDSSNSDSSDKTLIWVIIAFICGAILFNKTAREATFKLLWQIIKGIGAILLFIIAEALKGDKGKGSSSSQSQSQNRSQKVYWWQCKHCGMQALPIKKSNTPSAANCPSGKTFHYWTRLAEVGDINYQCKHCSTQIQARNTPSAANCPSGKTFHYWTKL